MIYFDDNKMIVQSYKKVLKVDENEVVFMFNKKTISVIGENISIPYLQLSTPQNATAITLCPYETILD